MLYSAEFLKSLLPFKVNGVLHVGAHNAEENIQYVRNSWFPVIWVEAQNKLADDLRNSLDSRSNRIIDAAVWDKNDIELELIITSNSQSSSLFELGNHKENYPDIIEIERVSVSTKRLDSLLTEAECPNFINIDIQGAELRALKGLGTLLKVIDCAYLEVNKEEVYLNCPRVSEIDIFMKENDFKRISTRWVLFKGWGDAIYLKDKYVELIPARLIWKLNYFQFIFYLDQYYGLAKVNSLKVIRFLRKI